MMKNPIIDIQKGAWKTLQQDAMFVRKRVFIEEQQIPEAEEWDAQDERSIHFVMYHDTQPIATARLLENRSVGRVAVLKPYRGLNIGNKLMQAIVDYAKQQNLPDLKLSAQVYATGFYERLGFRQHGEIYDDCGIPHIEMFLNFD
ncbi:MULTISPECIES: GNAT family N-acetyltransferase [unclassified Acinetobacter]|uniref:GNAT family N-acetyltransferase n=1 Tax=unclassified Acinetobacter TaxID=196816 RepID=UPI00190A71F1|nr:MULTISPECIES: GNAT family N-acetyltransferase [unclassified Acinetobacter]MBK0064396.1 GNAT family N-acetyltransferase [Acinetobacter sp. S55]MBK0067799.1 GNAT family N-acetyltransferase [Acinetobacter sp. S54]